MAENEIFIFYGSQTGQAETIAEMLHESAEEHGIKSTLMNLWKSEEAFRIASEGLVPVVYVCSTTGDGELPATARKFVRMLSRKTNPENLLSKLQYALLGLGDTNYSAFCGGPKILEKGLKKLGASSFYPTGYADDGTDLEIVVEPWIEGLWPALKALIHERKTAPQVPLQKLYIDPGTTTEEVQEISENMQRAKIDKDPQVGVALTEKASLNNQPPVSEVDVGTANTLQNYMDRQTETSSFKQSKDVRRLVISSESPLSDLSERSTGTLPPAMQNYLTTETLDQSESCSSLLTSALCTPYPLAVEENFHQAQIKCIEKLTAENAVKTAFCVTLGVPDGFTYEPGDSFGVVIQNPVEEVDWLIKRLNLESDCDKTIKIVIDQNNKKKNAKVPNYIPNVTTIRHVLLNCLEIRSVPKRSFLRALYDFTSSEREKNVLVQLSRKESMEDFVKYVREPYLNVIDILAALPSCLPPFSLLVEHLPRLKARQYSAASCLSVHPGEMRFVFNVVNFDPVDGRMYPRNGLATGYFSSLVNKAPTASQSFPNLTLFRTKNNSFRLPSPLENPIIMIGPGTGVAPFVGFLESLMARKSAGDVIPETLLYYGCRHRDRDYLFENDLKNFINDEVLSHLVVAFSRDTLPVDGVRQGEIQPKYVQHYLKRNSAEIADLLLRKNATFYVCGDARNMSKDVRQTVVEILSDELSETEARETLNELSKNGRYKEDVWT